jgi:polysaccharide export outer membrane protein
MTPKSGAFRRRFGRYPCLALLIVGAIFVVQARGQEADSAATTGAADDVVGGGRLGANYIIGPEDVLAIDVFNVPELKQSVRVSNDGTVALPLLGSIKAAGRTAQQLGHELEREYGRTYLEISQISVFVSQFHSQPISMIGAVNKPGIYQLTGPRTLIEVLSMAGGPAKESGRSVLVTRKVGFGALKTVDGMRLVAPDKLEIHLRGLLYTHRDGLNIDIQPLDSVSVSKAEIVYVAGDVRKPGGFVLEDRDSVTILQALAMAEGVNGTAAKHAARIIHRPAEGSQTETHVDLGKILKGKSQDLVLSANDILFVPSSSAKNAAWRGTEATVGVITGLIVYGRL